MGKKTPKAPDPAATIAAQTAANKEAITESARVNAVDQYGPSGSTTYQRGADGVPISQTVSLTPTGQATYDQQEKIAAGLTDKAATLADRIPTGPMDLSKLPTRQTSLSTSGLPAIQGVGDFGADAQRTQDATFQKAQALLKPGQQLDRSRLEQQLSDRGIPLDSAAGQAELTRMEASQSEANNRAAYDAVAAGGAEQSRLFGLSSAARGQLFGEGLTGANFTNDQRTSALQEALTLRNQDFNEASALLQGAPVMGTPGFMNTPTYNMQPTDVAGITQQGFQNRLQASQANNPMAGLFGLGSAAITKWSDRRLKRDLVPLGTGWRGLPLYLFKYVWGGAHEIGVMAQDVARVMPAAVIRSASGLLAVDYGKLREAP
ncbi:MULTISPECIES: tail fiber domain-containing protein [unclassified Aureimonas]|uniref:tail fiber domain-containing protein n=1 Tax=unclassified Aureimonas TaxID=2615206 RepID=UPI0006F53C9E|nr:MULTISPECIES: tail fiber domain-containing protein [unclassified Aureimonas]KQT52270.1 hypothetical protein ASG62_16575 [Aureimonas sp. Leaf427]KQT73244.1 hypothetical protein ASG54_17850 [Aureimonas sp. Leaf460]